MVNKAANSEKIRFFKEDLQCENCFTPEDFSDEHKMMAELADKFTEKQVVPLLEQMENGRLEMNVQLLRKAGELGLLGVDVPEEYGGLGLDKISATLITENMARGRSFNVTYSGQVGIGSLPIVYFGNKAQKEAFLPGVVSGEKIGAYALTEPTAGTDALSSKTVATLSECGRYYFLTGEKQFITNSGFADYFIIFAKVNREKFTSFIVPRDSDGLSTGAEEKKMGLKGSSTRSLILDYVKVPIENVLGEVGRGHEIAFNILNLGRHKISATCLGNSKQALELAVTFAKERSQFGRPIADFSIIKQKLADMTIKTYVNESMVYRTADLIDRALAGIGEDGKKFALAMGGLATECSINKVFSSEAYDFIIDEAVQIHGGYGFIADYEVETLYRDSRINRIFEGTNEINRILIATKLLRYFVGEEVRQSGEAPIVAGCELLISEKMKLSLSKRMLHKAIRGVNAQFKDVNSEQEVLGMLADTAIDIYAMESAIFRAEKAYVKSGEEKGWLKLSLTRTFVGETLQKLAIRFINFRPFIGEGYIDDSLLSDCSQLLKSSGLDFITEKRKIANVIIQRGQYTVGE